MKSFGSPVMILFLFWCLMTCVVIRDKVITFKALAVIKRTLMCCKKNSVQEASVKRLFALQLVFLPFLRCLIEHFLFQPLLSTPALFKCLRR